MVNHDLLAIGIAQREITAFGKVISPANAPLAAGSFYNTTNHWNKLLVEAGAVKYGTGVPVGGKLPETWLQEEMDRVGAGNVPTAFTIADALRGYRISSPWKCLCDGDRPKRPEHRYAGG